MKSKIMGIDPGLKGGIAIMSYEGVTMHEIPHIANRVNAEELIVFFRTWGRNVRMCFLEDLGRRPGQSVQSTITSAMNFGTLLTCLELSRVPFTVVPANQWAKVAHKGIDTKLKPKEKSQFALKRLYPEVMQSVISTKGTLHEGFMDAVLIAHYGWITLSGHDPATAQETPHAASRHGDFGESTLGGASQTP